MRQLPAILAVIAVLMLPAAPVSAKATFDALGRLPGELTSEAWGVSGDGSVVVGVSGTGGDTSGAFRWTRATGMQALPTPPAPGYSIAVGVSDDGSTVIGYASDEAPAGALPHAVRWTGSGAAVPLGTLPGGADYSLPSGVSRDGSVITGMAMGPTHQQAFRWTAAGGMVALPDLGPNAQFPQSSAGGFSDDGRVTGGQSTADDGRYTAVRWSADGSVAALPGLPAGAVFSGAGGVSNDGKVMVGAIVTATGRPIETFRWTEDGGFKLLREGGAAEVEYANGVSGDGRTIVGNNATFGAFIWDADHGVRELVEVLRSDYGLGEELNGWMLTSALGISDDGRAIVGGAKGPDGVEQAYLVVLPEPSSAGALLLLLSAGMLVRRRDLSCAPKRDRD